MILPNKHINIEESYLGLGASILNLLKIPQTVSRLWEKARNETGIGSFERFCLVLSFLYALEVITIDKGIISKVNS